MAYEKHTWECGESITADLMNNIEDGIEEALEASPVLSDHFIVLEGVIENVSNRGGIGSTNWTAQGIGVASLNDVTVISVAQTLASSSNPHQYHYGSHYVTSSGLSTCDFSYPSVYISNQNLYLNVFNYEEETGTSDIYYRLVLLKLR